jgi:hypothetical protein
VRGRDRDLLRLENGSKVPGPDISDDLNLPAGADATQARKLGFTHLLNDLAAQGLRPKMLTPTLTYINSDAKLREP